MSVNMRQVSVLGFQFVLDGIVDQQVEAIGSAVAFHNRAKLGVVKLGRCLHGFAIALQKKTRLGAYAA